MKQLSGTDDLFLTMESDRVFGHVSSVSILEASEAPEPITLKRVKEIFSARMHLLPMFRRRVVNVPFGIDHPYWVDDPDFDLDHHVRQVTLRRPGNAGQLARKAAQIVAEPLDRGRPLWQTTLIKGIEGGRVALLTKIHHAVVDGLGGNDVLTVLLDETKELRDVGPPPPWEPEPIPGPVDLLSLASVSLACRPLRAVELEWELAQALAGTVARVSTPDGYGGRLLSSALPVVPPTPFNRTITPGRAWAFRGQPLEDFRAIKSAFGYTVNDVVMAVVAGALRRWLIDRDALPAKPLVAGVPVSLRDPADHEPGNRVSMMIGTVPTHLPDPVERLHAAHEAMRAAKEQHGAVPASLLGDWSEFAIPGLASLAAREAAQLHFADWTSPPYNLVVSNVPGPCHTLYFAGAPLVGIYPLSALADGQGLNISLIGYCDTLHFGLLACPELVPNLADLADYLGQECALLVAATRPAPPVRQRRTGAPGRRRRGREAA